MPVEAVPDSISFPKEEEKVEQLWKKIDAFQTSLKQSKNRPRYTFYDGPPFATGLPHYGHILAGTVKDIVTRWAHQSGFHVERRFGWDCHGLPVEYEIDKSLGIKGPDDVEKMGIAKYNEECRKIVSRYATEWEVIMGRLGRWIDFHNDYKTMYPWFMESIWWVFKQLYNKGMVYKGFKVMPFSTACNTPLSNFECGQNYKDVQDPAVIVNFPLLDEPDTAIVAWTTTPWTLPSNLTLCVHPDLQYCKIKDKSNDKVYILMEARLEALFKSPDEYQLLERFPGSKLEGRSYEPIFNYFLYMKERGAFKVCCDTYVTEESGTGVVHQAPYFGEDDYRVNLKYNIITKESPPICPIDMCGCFTEEVTDFKGQYVKDADKNIMKVLKARGRLVHQSTTTHSYPFCWRSDTPLIYRAVPSWFVRVEQMTENLLQSNQMSYWVPDFVKEKRFGNWLRDARDWAISRNRYWGTPIPLWISEDGEEVVCIGSIEELNQLAGADVKDLHRESIDHLTIPSRLGKGILRRVPEVFDCWFESGSMPYAQNHYPFEKRKDFEDGFPGDFIAEGIDQTRGWFYTLIVLSTALFGKAPFKNLICHGLVLAADGQKMSKRKKNYPDPMDVVNSYGADAVRLYLVNSPVVRADNLRFKEEGVRDVVKDVFLPWFNAYRFLMQNIYRLHHDDGVRFSYNEATWSVPENYMDRWILSFTQSLIKYVKEEMAAYHLYTVVPRLVRFVDQLTNWYVRMNRRRLKGEGGTEDCQTALNTLFSVLFSMTKVMAPFIPFLTEYMYQNMKNVIETSAKPEEVASVHFLMLPQAHEDLIDAEIEQSVSYMQNVIDLGRIIRDRKTMPMKYPLKEVVVIHKDEHVLEEVQSLQNYIQEELNVKKVTVSRDKERYGVRLRAEPDFRALGQRLNKQLKPVMEAIKNLPDEALTRFGVEGEIEVLGHKLTSSDLKLAYTMDDTAKSTHYEAHSDGNILVLLDVTPSEEMVNEGLAREVINRIQKARKKGKLVPTDKITVYFNTSSELSAVITQFADFIFDTIKQPLLPYPVPNGAKVIVTEQAKIKSDSLDLTIVLGSADNVAESCAPSCKEPPVCPYVNVVMGEKRAVVLLENPKGKYTLNSAELVRQAANVLGLPGKKLTLTRDAEGNDLVSSNNQNILELDGKTLYAKGKNMMQNFTSPVCRFANVELQASQSAVGVLLLENPSGQQATFSDLQKQVQVIFDSADKMRLYTSKDKKEEVTSQTDLFSLHSVTLYASS